MPRSARASIKLTPGKQLQIAAAIDLLQAHYGEALALWGQLTPAQQDDLLAHSPLLARIIALVRPTNGS